MINKDPDDVRSPGFCCVIGSILAMENQNWKILNVEAVITDSSLSIFKDFSTFTVEQLKQRLTQTLGNTTLLRQGEGCRVLEPGQQWRRGRFRLTIEFLPDEEPQA